MKINKEITIEVCATSVDSAIAAEKGGAKRIELCDNLIEGGTTPGAGSIILARKKLEIDLFVLIRPRGGDFLYNDIEFDIIKKDIIMVKQFKADGVVIGILDKNGFVDMKRTEELIKLARPMGVTFNRAFDKSADPYTVLDQLIELKVDRLLTSGQKNTALLGAGLISELIEKADTRIEIMPGAGINTDNFYELMIKTKARNFHLSGRKKVDSLMNFRNKEVNLSDSNKSSDFECMLTDENIIREIVSISRNK